MTPKEGESVPFSQEQTGVYLLVSYDFGFSFGESPEFTYSEGTLESPRFLKFTGLIGATAFFSISANFVTSRRLGAGFSLVSKASIGFGTGDFSGPQAVLDTGSVKPWSAGGGFSFGASIRLYPDPFNQLQNAAG